MADGASLQHGFSSIHPGAMRDVARRRQKAAKVVAVLQDHLGDTSRLSLLDIGCSLGYMTERYAACFGAVTGIDIDEAAIAEAVASRQRDNLRFEVGDSLNLKFPAASFDVATCSMIYEHVPDAARMMAEIYRVLKPGGVCYFGAQNRLAWMEEHYHIPLLSVIPKRFGHVVVQSLGLGERYYETHLSYWGLRKLARQFHVIDYTRSVIDDPERFAATDMLRPGSIKHRVARLVSRWAPWACPTYIWLLRK